MEYSIRRAQLSDASAIQSMAEVAFRHTYRQILSPAQMEYMMDWMYSDASLQRQLTVDGHVYLILRLADGRDVGYVSFSDDTPPERSAVPMSADATRRYHLQKIYLLPDVQRLGLGAVLLHAAEALMLQLAGDGPVQYELNVNRNNGAVAFYRRMGLSILRQGDFDIGDGFYMNDYIMGRTLR